MLRATNKYSVFMIGIAGFLIYVAIGAQAVADEWNIVSGDERLTSDYLEEHFVGRKLEFESGQSAVFNSDGSYEFHVGGKVYHYTYFFTDDGVICISSPDRGSRCDLMVKNSNDYYSINDSGGRYKGFLK
jgi:hypothetical protein